MSPVKHRPKVRKQLAHTPQGEAWTYRLVCTCGAEFETHDTKRDAQHDRTAHLTEVAPPADQRCRDPKKHRCQPHDYCPLCANQIALPGLEEIA